MCTNNVPSFIDEFLWGQNNVRQQFLSVCEICYCILLTYFNNCCTWTWQRFTKVTLRQRYLKTQEGTKASENEMPAADLHASTGSVHIIKARGRSQWFHLCPSPHRMHQGPTHWFVSAVILNSFSHQLRDGGRWDLHMYMRLTSF